MMGRLLFLISVLMLLWTLSSCQRNNWLLQNGQPESIELKVQSIDSTRFSNYYTVNFRSKSGKRGAILMDKDVGLLAAHLFPRTGFQTLRLRDVIQFKMDDITLRGHGIEGGFYVDGVGYIDLTPQAKRPFYSLAPEVD